MARIHFGTTPDGEKVDLFTLSNDSGMRAEITNYGGYLVSLLVPAPDGRLLEAVLGYDSLEGYLADKNYLGCLVGRFANRIARAKFVFQGREYTLAANDGPNHLHGGRKGFSHKVWRAEPFHGPEGQGVSLSCQSPDGEEGYPGNLEVKAVYTLAPDNALRIDYEAVADAPTIINLTQHSYFNLNGDPARNCLDHEVSIRASRYLPVDSAGIPLGGMADVTGTPMDFTRETVVGRALDTDFPQVAQSGGFDHNWVLDGQSGELEEAATCFCPDTGLRLRVLTTEPGLQFYSGNFLDGSVVGRGGQPLKRHAGFCFEAQHYPDSPNQGHFPSVVLEPGQRYTQTTVYAFGPSE